MESGNRSPSARLRLLWLRVVAGLGVQSSSIESSDTDVEDALVDELEGPFDKPGTTINTLILSVALYVPLPFFLQDVVLTTGLHS